MVLSLIQLPKVVLIECVVSSIPQLLLTVGSISGGISDEHSILRVSTDHGTTTTSSEGGGSRLGLFAISVAFKASANAINTKEYM